MTAVSPGRSGSKRQSKRHGDGNNQAFFKKHVLASEPQVLREDVGSGRRDLFPQHCHSVFRSNMHATYAPSPCYLPACAIFFIPPLKCL